MHTSNTPRGRVETICIKTCQANHVTKCMLSLVFWSSNQTLKFLITSIESMGSLRTSCNKDAWFSAVCEISGRIYYQLITLFLELKLGSQNGSRALKWLLRH
ncbi:hypothetical protein AHF37_08446 [Paragonimus kellicotti]|nr:hypothetical protein AHF37_08446 [Paragonimus kellicotti]